MSQDQKIFFIQKNFIHLTKTEEFSYFSMPFNYNSFLFIIFFGYRSVEINPLLGLHS